MVPLPIPARVGAESDDVDPGRIKIKVWVAVGVGDGVLLVEVAVGVGDLLATTRAVPVAAAAAVCTMYVLAAPGTNVGAGLTAPGITQAVISSSDVSHRNP
jgi:hypothetical protein